MGYVKHVLIIFFLFSIAACSSTAKEENPSALQTIPAQPLVKVDIRIPSTFSSEQDVWVDFGAEFFDSGNGALKFKNVKLVDSSHPNSKELIDRAKLALSKWVYVAKSVGEYKGKRYLVRVK